MRAKISFDNFQNRILVHGRYNQYLGESSTSRAKIVRDTDGVRVKKDTAQISSRCIMDETATDIWFECKHCKIHDIVKLKTENFVLIRSGQMTRTKHWQRFNRKNANTIKKS